MQKSDRQKLNERFVFVYRELEVKGQIVKSHRGRSKSAFAESLNTKGHIIDKYLNGERKITYEQVKKLCQIYDVSEAYMFQGIGEAFPNKRPPINPQLPNKNQKESLADGVPAQAKTKFNILFTSIEAFASDTVGIEVAEENQYFHIPGLQGDLIAFNIRGNSMSPTISSGDMVICSPLETRTEIEENEIYAVATRNSVRVKRAQRIYDNYGNWTHLKLISDNYIDYDPIHVELHDIRKIFKVVRRVTNLVG